MVTASCKSWNDDEGWGVLTAEALPGEVFSHFSAIDGPGYRALEPGERVMLEWEAPGQDGYPFRATRVVRRASNRPSTAA